MKSKWLLAAAGLSLMLAMLASWSGIRAPFGTRTGGHVALAAPKAPNAQFVNGDFESGSGVGWTEYSLLGQPIIVHERALKGSTDVTPHGGSWLAWLGGTEGADELSYIKQQVTIDAGAPVLAYWHWVESIDVCGWDWARVLVNGTEVTKFSLCMNTNTGAWVRRTADLSAYIGQTVWVQFQADTNQWNFSSWFVDDVTLEAATGPTRTPTATGTATATRTPRTPTSSATASPTGRLRYYFRARLRPLTATTRTAPQRHRYTHSTPTASRTPRAAQRGQPPPQQHRRLPHADEQPDSLPTNTGTAPVQPQNASHANGLARRRAAQREPEPHATSTLPARRRAPNENSTATERLRHEKRLFPTQHHGNGDEQPNATPRSDINGFPHADKHGNASHDTSTRTLFNGSPQNTSPYKINGISTPTSTGTASGTATSTPVPLNGHQHANQEHNTDGTLTPPSPHPDNTTMARDGHQHGDRHPFVGIVWRAPCSAAMLEASNRRLPKFKGTVSEVGMVRD
jgi:hypothetical protein